MPSLLQPSNPPPPPPLLSTKTLNPPPPPLLSTKTLNPPPPPLLSTKTLIIMAPQGQWETFTDDDHEDEETLSLSDLSTKRISLYRQQDKKCNSSEALEDFEVQTFDNGNGLFYLKPVIESHMCVADDIFYHGQLLPLRSYGTLSDSNSRFSSGSSFSSGSNNSISSSNCSSTSISRSQSSSSHSSASCDPPRLSISNKFYAHPSPRPQVRSNVHSGRRSTGSAPPGWSLLRLGVVKTPEIDIHDLKLRQLRSSELKCEPKPKKSMPRFGFGCNCAPDVSEPVPVPVSVSVSVSVSAPGLMSPAKPLVSKKIGLERRGGIGKSSRVFEWLEELATRKGSG